MNDWHIESPIKFLDDKVTLHIGDCMDVMQTLPSNSIDSVVTDPPYELKFMGKKWDGTGIAYSVPMWSEVLRVLKPGGYIFAFSSSRTYHRMACAIEDAGFITHPMVGWLFGSGFPKAHNLSKQIDKNGPSGQTPFAEFAKHYEIRRNACGLSHAKICEIGGWYGEINHGGSSANWANGYGIPTIEQWKILQPLLGLDDRFAECGRIEYEREIIGKRKVHPGLAFTSEGPSELDITAPATDAAKQWDGWFYGTQSLKPALEPIYMGQKPFSERTGADNVLRWGTGAINVEACRVAADWANDPSKRGLGYGWAKKGATNEAIFNPGARIEYDTSKGRWPANIITDGSPEVLAGFPETKSGHLKREHVHRTKASTYGEPTQNCGAAEYGNDSGSAARFFTQAEFTELDQPWLYCPKANKQDRAGSKHPTVKPVKLMQWLIRMVTPPGGTTLDPFAGTGTSAEAAYKEGMDSILIEMEPEYAEDIQTRIRILSVANIIEKVKEIVEDSPELDFDVTIFPDRLPS